MVHLPLVLDSHIQSAEAAYGVEHLTLSDAQDSRAIYIEQGFSQDQDSPLINNDMAVPVRSRLAESALQDHELPPLEQSSMAVAFKAAQTRLSLLNFDDSGLTGYRSGNT